MHINFLITFYGCYHGEICLIMSLTHFFNGGTSNGNEFMHIHELVDAGEAIGLSRVPIVYVHYKIYMILFTFK